MEHYTAITTCDNCGRAMTPNSPYGDDICDRANCGGRTSEPTDDFTTDPTQLKTPTAVTAMSLATIPTEDTAEDYVIVLNGDPIEWQDAGGHDPDGYVMGSAELNGDPVEVTVSYGPGGVSGCSIYVRERDESYSLTEQSADDAQFLEFYTDERPDVSACVELLPKSEVSDAPRTPNTE